MHTFVLATTSMWILMSAAGLLFHDGAAELSVEPLELSVLVAREGFERGGKLSINGESKHFDWL